MSFITSKGWVISTCEFIIINNPFIIFKVIYFFYSKIVYNDLQSITPEQYYKEIHNRRIAEIHAVSVSIFHFYVHKHLMA